MHRSKGKHFQRASATVLCATVNSKARGRLEESAGITILSAPPLTCINDVYRMRNEKRPASRPPQKDPQAASAVNLKFLSVSRQVRLRNFKFKAALEINKLLELL